MFKILSFLIAWIIITPSVTVYAQENSSTFDRLKPKLEFIRNPFESHLPKKDIPKPPEPEKTCSDDIQYCLTQTDCISQMYHWYDGQCNTNPKIEPPTPPTEPQIPTPETPLVVAPSIPMPTFTISGIIWNSDRPQAIINQQIVDIGDTIAGAKITNIQKSGIDILFNGETATIHP